MVEIEDRVCAIRAAHSRAEILNLVAEARDLRAQLAAADAEVDEVHFQIAAAQVEIDRLRKSAVLQKQATAHDVHAPRCTSCRRMGNELEDANEAARVAEAQAAVLRAVLETVRKINNERSHHWCHPTDQNEKRMVCTCGYLQRKKALGTAPATDAGRELLDAVRTLYAASRRLCRDYDAPQFFIKPTYDALDCIQKFVGDVN